MVSHIILGLPILLFSFVLAVFFSFTHLNGFTPLTGLTCLPTFTCFIRCTGLAQVDFLFLEIHPFKQLHLKLMFALGLFNSAV